MDDLPTMQQPRTSELLLSTAKTEELASFSRESTGEQSQAAVIFEEEGLVANFCTHCLVIYKHSH